MLTILLLIYRSPVLALVPLITVIIAYSIASGVIKVLADSGMQVTSISTSCFARRPERCGSARSDVSAPSPAACSWAAACTDCRWS